MAIFYDASVRDTKNSTRRSPILDSLRNINESFQQQGVNVLNEGFADVATNSHYFSDYIQQLSEHLDERTAAEFEVLAENTRKVILTESTISGVSPVTALSLPILRVSYPKTSVREGLPTEPVTQPKFTVKWMRPYVIDSNNGGEKLYLPKTLRTTQGRNLFNLPQLTEAVNLTSNSIFGYDLLTGIVGAQAYPNMDMIDPVFRIKGVTVVIGDGTVSTSVAKDVDFKLDTLTNVAEGLVTAATTVAPIRTATVRVFAKVDREKCTMDVIGAVVSTTGAGTVAEIDAIAIEGYLSSEMNNRATQIGFETTDDPTTIGTGHPIESPINIQQMTDAMAMYNIDTTVRHLEIMSSTLAQVTDLQGVNFLKGQFAKIGTALQATLTETFDVTPPANYALGNTAWREELKIKIDRLITKMMNETNYYNGTVVIFGNPIDTQVINNVRWTYSESESPNGVNIDYRLGVYTSGVTTFKVLSSFNWPQGDLYAVFLPSEEDQKTVTYYPYSYHVLRGAASPNAVNLPSIQMIKRYTFREYTPMIGKIVLQNNM
jgi:hypothetical protein